MANHPFAALAARGECEFRWHDVRHLSEADLAWADVVVLARPLFPADWLAAKGANRLGRKLLTCWDDDPMTLPNIFGDYQLVKHAALQSMQLECLRLSSHILACSTYTGEKLANVSGTPALVLPVPAIAPLTAQANRNAKAPQFTVGFAGSIGHKEVIEDLLIPALVSLWQKGYAIRFECIGPAPNIPKRFRHFTSCSDPVDFNSWPERRNTLNWHVAVAPLQETEFNRSKYHNKFIEYGAAGIPCIFSDVAPYRSVIVNGHNGWLAENSQIAWEEALLRVYRAPLDEIERVGEAARLQVTRDNHLQVVVSAYRKILDEYFAFRAPQIRVTTASLAIIRWLYSLRFLGVRLYSNLSFAHSIGTASTIERLLRRARMMRSRNHKRRRDIKTKSEVGSSR